MFNAILLIASIQVTYITAVYIMFPFVQRYFWYTMAIRITVKNVCIVLCRLNENGRMIE